ncbi:MAG TPA: DUF1326 domain-containing protein [Bryobacteraceae bacterium]|jgi:hypothetical protein
MKLFEGACVSLFLSAGLTLAAGLPSQSITGNYMEARTADVYTGPCFANAETGLVGQLAVMGWKVSHGSWNGVDLSGLSVVGVVRAQSTLGDVEVKSNPAKAVLIIDSKADPAQRMALTSFAKHMSNNLLADVVRVETQPIDLAIENNDLHSRNATLTAGSLAKIETRGMTEHDQICHNEEVWYQPLSRTSHAMPAYALSHQYEGKGLGVTWSSPDKRSAFVASFSEPSE